MSQPRPTPEPPTAIQLGADARILVVKLAATGDLLLATPALRLLRSRYPRARIDLLTTSEAAALLSRSRLVDRVLTLDKYAFDYPSQIARRPWRLLSLAPLLRALRRTRYDAVLLLHHLTLPFGRLKYRSLLALTGARHRIGYDNGTGGFLTVRIPDEGFGARHEAQYNLDAVAAIGAVDVADPHDVRLSDLSWDVTPAPRDRDTPVIAIHPGGGTYSLARRWPLERFAELASALHAEAGAAIILTGGRDEAELRAHIAERAGHPAWLTCAEETNLQELATLLASVDLFIGNDSLPMHLAAAAGTPVVAIFGPSNADAWRPWVPAAWSRAVVVRRDDLACSPCFYRGHSLGTPQGCPPRPCLTELPVRRVLAESLRLLAAERAARPAG